MVSLCIAQLHILMVTPVHAYVDVSGFLTASFSLASSICRHQGFCMIVLCSFDYSLSLPIVYVSNGREWF